MILTLPLAAGKRYFRRDGSITPPLTLNPAGDGLQDPETRYYFPPDDPLVLFEPDDPKDLVADYHETRDGRPVRILATDVSHPIYKIAAAVMNSEGHEIVEAFTANGYYLTANEPEDIDIVTLKLPFQLEVGKVYQTEDGDRFEIVHYVPIKDIFIGIDSSNDVYGFHPSGTCTTDRITLTKEVSK
jgi:hypothetical protein